MSNVKGHKGTSDCATTVLDSIYVCVMYTS